MNNGVKNERKECKGEEHRGGGREIKDKVVARMGYRKLTRF
jgi:hypothetical protein